MATPHVSITGPLVAFISPHPTPGHRISRWGHTIIPPQGTGEKGFGVQANPRAGQREKQPDEGKDDEQIAIAVGAVVAGNHPRRRINEGGGDGGQKGGISGRERGEGLGGEGGHHGRRHDMCGWSWSATGFAGQRWRNSGTTGQDDSRLAVQEELTGFQMGPKNRFPRLGL